MAEYVMRATLTGTRNGKDWPPAGAPAPADLSVAEVKQLAAAGIIGTAAPAEPAPVESAADRTPVETATRKAGPRRATKGV